MRTRKQEGVRSRCELQERAEKRIDNIIRAMRKFYKEELNETGKRTGRVKTSKSRRGKR